jgi:hypothetical protein
MEKEASADESKNATKEKVQEVAMTTTFGCSVR